MSMTEINQYPYRGLDGQMWSNLGSGLSPSIVASFIGHERGLYLHRLGLAKIRGEAASHVSSYPPKPFDCQVLPRSRHNTWPSLAGFLVSRLTPDRLVKNSVSHLDPAHVVSREMEVS